MHGNPFKVAQVVQESAKPGRNHSLADAAPLPSVAYQKTVIRDRRP